MPLMDVKLPDGKTLAVDSSLARNIVDNVWKSFDVLLVGDHWKDGKVKGVPEQHASVFGNGAGGYFNWWTPTGAMGSGFVSVGHVQPQGGNQYKLTFLLHSPGADDSTSFGAMARVELADGRVVIAAGPAVNVSA